MSGTWRYGYFKWLISEFLKVRMCAGHFSFVTRLEES